MKELLDLCKKCDDATKIALNCENCCHYEECFYLDVEDCVCKEYDKIFEAIWSVFKEEKKDDKL